MYFCYFVIISPKKRTMPFSWKNSNFLYPRMVCAKFGWKCFVGSGEFLIFINFWQYIFPYPLLSPLRKWYPFYYMYNKIWIPIIQGCFVQIWLKLAHWSSINHQYIFVICILIKSPLGKGCVPSFQQSQIPFTQESFMPSLVEIGPVVLKKKMNL